MEKSILITGCSSGIGLAAAEILQKRGYRVFATARKDSDVECLKVKGLESLKLDIQDPDSIKSALAEVLKRTGGTLYALFNNCGYVQAGAIEDLSRDLMLAQFETNVFGPMELTRQVLPFMRQQGYGRIVQNSSLLGIVTMPFLGAYNASKFALNGFTHTLRQELRGTAIHVSIIAPGPITTKLRENAKHYFSAGINQENSVFRQDYQGLEKRYSEQASARDQYFSLAPQAVVKALIDALESKHPKTHYFVGGPAKLFATLRRLLPEQMLDWLLTKFS